MSRAEIPPQAGSIDRWAARTAALATDHGFRAVAAELRELVRRAAAEPPRVAIVGLPSVGKSRLVNELLGVVAVEEAAVSRGSRATVIRAVARPATTLPSFEAAMETSADPAPVPDLVELENPWLRGAGVELVETSGLWSGSQLSDEVSRRIARHSDVAVVVVRARGGMSVQERTLIGELAAAPWVGRTLVAVSMLDELTGDDAEVMARIRALARRTDPRVEVLPVGAGLAAELRGRLTGLAAELRDPENRSSRLLAAITETCETLIAEAARRLDAQAAADERRAEARRAVEQERRAADARWALIGVEFDRRRTELSGRILAECASGRARVMEAARSRLAGAAPDAAWDACVDGLADDLRAAAQETSALTIRTFNETATWLNKQLAELIRPLPREDIQGVVDRARETGTPDLRRAEENLQALATERTDAIATAVLDTGRGVVDVALQLLPLNIPPEASSGLLDRGQSALRGRILKNRGDKALAATDEAVRRFFDRLPDAVTEQVGPYFDELLDLARQHYEAWWRARLEIWSARGAPWERLRAEATDLMNEIRRGTE